MATFLELQTALKKLQEEKAILLELVDHLEGHFITPPDEKLMVILTEDRQKVPKEMVEEVLEKVLLSRANAVQAEITKIIEAPMLTEEKKEEPEPSQEEKPDTKKKSKS